MIEWRLKEWLNSHGSHCSQRLSQRARLLQIIGNFSIFTAMVCDSCWLQQIHSWTERALSAQDTLIFA